MNIPSWELISIFIFTCNLLLPSRIFLSLSASTLNCTLLPFPTAATCTKAAYLLKHVGDWKRHCGWVWSGPISEWKCVRACEMLLLELKDECVPSVCEAGRAQRINWSSLVFSLLYFDLFCHEVKTLPLNTPYLLPIINIVQFESKCLTSNTYGNRKHTVRVCVQVRRMLQECGNNKKLSLAKSST